MKKDIVVIEHSQEFLSFFPLIKYEKRKYDFYHRDWTKNFLRAMGGSITYYEIPFNQNVNMDAQDDEIERLLPDWEKVKIVEGIHTNSQRRLT